MKKSTKILLYSIVLLLGILIFVLQLFVFEGPDGVFGFLLCMSSVYMMIGGTIKLYKTSEVFKKVLTSIIDAVFFW